MDTTVVNIETAHAFESRRYIKLGDQLVGHIYLELDGSAILQDIPTGYDEISVNGRRQGYTNISDAVDGGIRRWNYLAGYRAADGWDKDTLDNAPW